MARVRMGLSGMLVLMLGVSAQAGAVKVTEFFPLLTGEVANPEVDGVGIFNFVAPQGVTEARLTLTKLEAGKFYDIFIIHGQGAVSGFLVDSNSAGTLHVNTTIGANATANDFNITIFVFLDGNNDDVPQACELRAIGCVTGDCTVFDAIFASCTVDADCGSGQECFDGYCQPAGSCSP